MTGRQSLPNRIFTVHGPRDGARPGVHFEADQADQAASRACELSRSYTCQRPADVGRCPLTYEEHCTVPSPMVDRLRAEIERLDRWLQDRVREVLDTRLRRLAVSDPDHHQGIVNAAEFRLRELERIYLQDRGAALRRLVHAEYDRAAAGLGRWLDTVTADDFTDAATAQRSRADKPRTDAAGFLLPGELARDADRLFGDRPRDEEDR